MRYLEIKPTEKLRAYILNYWLFQVPSLEVVGQPQINHVAPADGCVSFLFSYFKASGLKKVFLIGPTSTNISRTVFPDYICVGVRFIPGMFHALFGISPLELQPSASLPEKFIYKPLLEELLSSVDSDFQDFTIFDSIWLQIIAACPLKMDTEVIKAAQTILKTNGALPIREIIQNATISERPLQKRFRYKTGLSMKELARVCRLRAVLIDMLVKKKADLDSISAAGYFDQAHFIHDLTLATGRNPATFKAHIHRIEHVGVESYHQQPK